MTITGLVLPGYQGSGELHWQTLWERSDPGLRRVEQRSFEEPVCREWVEALEAAVAASGPDVVLVAHSLGCLLVVHWAAASSRQVRGALLVAPPDPERADFPPQIAGFSPLPERRLPFPSLLVASSDDPYCAPARAQEFARRWGSRLMELGALGHINADSGLLDWPAGRALLREL